MNTSPANAAARWRYRVLHETRYAYQSQVTLSQQFLHMTPRNFSFQQTESHHLHVEPGQDEGVDGID